MTSARRHAAVSGLLGVVLFAVGSLIWGRDMPEDGTPVREVVAWYQDVADEIVIGGSLSLLAIAAIVWFAAALRQVLIEAGGEEFVATAAFGGALLGSAAGLGAESLNLVAGLRAQDGELTDALAQSLFEICQVLGAASSGVGFGVTGLATAWVALRTGRVLPRPVAFAVLAFGVLLLTPLAHVNWVPGAILVLMGGAIALALLREESVPAPAGS